MVYGSNGGQPFPLIGDGVDEWEVGEFELEVDYIRQSEALKSAAAAMAADSALYNFEDESSAIAGMVLSPLCRCFLRNADDRFENERFSRTRLGAVLPPGASLSWLFPHQRNETHSRHRY